MTNGKINEHGFLQVERKRLGVGTMKPQKCYKDITRLCGDQCPLFGEPYNESMRTREGERVQGVCLQLCYAIWAFKEFTDERTKQDTLVMEEVLR